MDCSTMPSLPRRDPSRFFPGRRATFGANVMNGTIKWLAASWIRNTNAAPISPKGLQSVSERNSRRWPYRGLWTQKTYALGVFFECRSLSSQVSEWFGLTLSGWCFFSSVNVFARSVEPGKLGFLFCWDDVFDGFDPMGFTIFHQHLGDFVEYVFQPPNNQI